MGNSDLPREDTPFIGYIGMGAPKEFGFSAVLAQGTRALYQQWHNDLYSWKIVIVHFI